jgi:hypothetical protein
LARSLCRFNVVDLSAVPKNMRTKALALQLGQLSAYAHTGHYAAWDEGKALVWFWDQDVVLRSMALAGVTPQRVRVLPESALYAAHGTGVRLLTNLQGMEAQWWQEGHLLQARWWKQAPIAQEWLDFQRDLGLVATDRQVQVPTPMTLPLEASAAPALSYGGGDALGAGWRDERLAYSLGLLLLFAPTAWMAAGWAKSSLALEDITAATRAAEGIATPLMNERDQALKALARSEALLALDRYPDTLNLMARFSGVLPKGGAYLREWDFREGKLKLVLVMPDKALSNSALVSLLQADGSFDDVQIAPGNDPKTVVIRAEVVPLHRAAHV